MIVLELLIVVIVFKLPPVAFSLNEELPFLFLFVCSVCYSEIEAQFLHSQTPKQTSVTCLFSKFVSRVLSTLKFAVKYFVISLVRISWRENVTMIAIVLLYFHYYCNSVATVFQPSQYLMLN